MKSKSLKLGPAISLLQNWAVKLKRYAGLLFFLLLAAVYGFVLFRINTLGNAEPSSSAVKSGSNTTKIPHIDDTVAKQLKTLQDNSVSVHSLFDNARSNPFQE